MRYSEMIAREKHRARQRGELPGGVSDLSPIRPVWFLAAGAIVILIFILA